MKYLKIFIVILTFIVSINSPAQTDKTGTTAGQVLKINVGPRAIGMGGAYTASANDMTALFWNPAGITQIPGSEAGFVHASLYADISHDYAGFVTNVPGFGALGAFVTALSMDDMPVTTIEMPEGTGELFSANSLVIGLSFARNLTDHFSIGFNAKYINEHIYHMNAAGFAIDAGTLYKIDVLNELRIAASISNFGSSMKLEGRDNIVVTNSGADGSNLINSTLELDEFSLPLVFRFGVASDIVRHESYRISVELDAVHPNDHSEYINSGVEYGWNNTFFLRAGYNSLFEKDSEKGFTFGIGIDYKMLDLVDIKFDYAYQYFGRLNNIHYLSLGVKF